MGLLGKVLGLEKKGKIVLTVDKPSYVAGELVVGTIAVTVFDPIECDAVVLKATGKEKVEWAEQRSTTDGQGRTTMDSQDFKKEKEFFKEKIVISSIPSTYLPGNYTYPFEYQLPPDLPGVFQLDGCHAGHIQDVKCKISYKLKATLDVSGFFAKDLKAKRELVVHEQLTQAIQPSHDETSQHVHFLCCFNKGTCHLDVAMDKNVYLAGETAQILCKIQNESQVDITAMSCTLLQDIEFQAHGRTERITRELCRQKYHGVPAGTTLEQPQPLLLVPNVQKHAMLSPSTCGRLVKCLYRVDVQCDIPWCPDVHLTLPLQIIAPILIPMPYAPPAPQSAEPV